MSTDPRALVLTELRKQTALLERIANALAPQKVSDAFLDGQYGDPVVKAKDPRDWTGEPMTGKRFSECPPAYLDLLAERYDYFASKETDAKKQAYAVKDAQRARGWAARIRAGWKPAEPATTNAGGEPNW